MNDNVNILLAEDSQHDVHIFERALKQFNRPYELTHCSRGEEAISQVRQDPNAFHILISDYNMPGMNGLDLCQRLIEMDVPFPIIILTGSGAEYIAAEALRLGVDDYIIKDPKGGYRNLLSDTLEGVMRKYADRRARKAAEAALREANDSLERRVGERTADLAKANDQLRREMSERRRAEEAVRASRDQLRLITDNMPALIAQFDTEQRFRFANKIAQRWYARPSHDLLGKPLGEFFSGADHDKMQASIETVLSGRTAKYEPQLVYPDGVRRDVEITYLPEFDEDGAVSGWFSLSIDVTQRRQDEDQLRQYKKMEALGQLTGGVAHDFNNLLSIVLGNAEILETAVGEDLPELQAIMRAAIRGGELTHRLLAFSRKQPLEPRALDLHMLATDMVAMLDRILGATIEVEVRSEAALWSPNADAGQVETALMNLAVNAQHAMQNGGRLVLELSNVVLDEAYAAHHDGVSPGQYVLLSVTDDGAGMSAEVLEHVFEPFFTTKDVGAGTGLGLSMVYGFAQQSGGHVTIESEEGQGTTVGLYLPRASDPVRSNDLAADSDVPHGGGKRVLVVEDDDDLRAMTVSMLGRLGYAVFEAADGAAALQVLRHSRPVDLLLSDVALPGGMSGPKIAETVRLESPETAILFMSGYAENVCFEGVSLSDSPLLLNKPFQLGELAKAARAAIERDFS